MRGDNILDFFNFRKKGRQEQELKDNKTKFILEQINDPARSDFFKLLNNKIDKLIEQGEEIFKSEIGYLLYPLNFILNKIYLEGKKSVLINDKLIYDLRKNINEVGLIIEKIELLFREQELKKEKEEEKQVVKTDDDIINEFFNL